MSCFDDLPKHQADRVSALYGIDGKSTRACRQGALELLGDYKFAEPPVRYSSRWRSKGLPVYHYVLDEVNPFRHSLGAHHGIDILYLFGDYDLSKTPELERTGREMRCRWIRFVNGLKPWDGVLAAFGPFGVFDELDKGSSSNRRRWAHLKVIQDLRPALDRVMDRLATGKFENSGPRI